MATLTEIRQRVRELLSLPVTTSDTGSPSNTQLDATVEDVRAYVYTMIAAKFARRMAVSTTMTYTASAESVALAAGLSHRMILAVEAVYPDSTDTKDRYALEEMTTQELLQADLDGTPNFYAIDYADAVIRIRPIPNVAKTLTVKYVPGLTALSTSTSPTEWPSEFHHIVISQGVYAWWLKKTKDPDWQGAVEDFEDRIMRLEAYIESIYPDTHLRSKARRRT